VERETDLVLVVEADPPVRELLSDVLKDEGYDVMTAYDGENARKMVAARRVDVVAIDLDAPEDVIGGLLREVRSSEVEPLVVALSSSQPPSRGARWAHAVVAKPFDIDELVEVVRRLLASRRVSQRMGREARSGRRRSRVRAYGVPERPALSSLAAGS